MDWIWTVQERLKVDFWLKQYVREGTILPDGKNWEKNQFEGEKESYFMFIFNFFHSDISSL